MKENKSHQCSKIDYVKNKEIIKQRLSIDMGTEVSLGTTVVGYMIRESGKAKLQALGCTKAVAGYSMCTACKSLIKKIRALKVTPPPAVSTITQTEEVTFLDAKRVVPTCRWVDCGCGVTFRNVKELIDHISSMVEFQNVAPHEKSYTCRWEGCRTVAKKKKIELMNHLMDYHTGT